ncbi:hypothetical protein L1887_61998 [Cichorium endivia]|nr:hypothetical protein L1887_61998 [Cichorium endivia]
MILGVIIGEFAPKRTAEPFGRQLPGRLGAARGGTHRDDVAHPHQGAVRTAAADVRHTQIVVPASRIARAQLDPRSAAHAWSGVGMLARPRRLPWLASSWCGLARCIAMVMIWNKIARGDSTTCAIIVIFNSILQIVLYAPLAVLFVNVISNDDKFQLDYSDVAIAVAIYLGIPLAAGVLTRFLVLGLFGRKFSSKTASCPYFGPLSLVALLYTIIIIFAEQAQHILDNLGPVFRTFVPLVLYFALMWTGSFVLIWWLSLRSESRSGDTRWPSYRRLPRGATISNLPSQSASPVFGVGSDQALAATIGPLVEVPVLLVLSWVAMFVGKRLRWDRAWDAKTRISVSPDCRPGK